MNAGNYFLLQRDNSFCTIHSHIFLSSTNRILHGLITSSNRGRPVFPVCLVVQPREELYTCRM
jgi:hypothetical protein